MYQIGQQVLYGAHGICTIQSVETLRFGKTKAEYYVLKPLSQPDSKYYIPVNNASAVEKLRPLMTKEEILAMLHSPEARQKVWVEDENLRKQKYRELLADGDRSQMLNMIYCLHRHRREQKAAGRKFHQCDEGFLKDAERLMNGEFAYILGIEPGQVADFILREMEEAEPV